jgi:hypothetical protein
MVICIFMVVTAVVVAATLKFIFVGPVLGLRTREESPMVRA